MNLPYELTQSIEFHFIDYERFPLPEEEIRKWIIFIVTSEKKTVGVLNFIFTNDEYLHKMNVGFLEHDTLTDVITFDYTEELGNVSGDIFISLERVKENATDLELSFEHEALRIIAHGLLHIIGYGDKQPDEKAVMSAREDYYLQYVDFL